MIQGLSESLTTKTVKHSFLFLKSVFPFYIVLRKALRILHLLYFSAVFFFVFVFHFFGFAFSFYCLFFSISLPLIRFSQVISIDGWLDFQQQAWVGMMNISEITVPRAFWQALTQQVFKEIVFICFESPIFILSFSSQVLEKIIPHCWSFVVIDTYDSVKFSNTLTLTSRLHLGSLHSWPKS